MSMTRDQMLRYLDNPSVLNERTLGELREILDEYPFFQSAHLLYIRNLQIENNFRFLGHLKTTAIYASDRSVLYYLLNSGLEKKRVNNRPLEFSFMNSLETNQMIELSDDPSEQREGTETLRSTVGHTETGHFDLLNFDLSDQAYSLGGTEDEAKKPLNELVKEINHQDSGKEKAKEVDQNSDLIDRFIKDNPTIIIKQSELSVQSEQSETAEKIDKPADTTGERDEFITETLARIYVNQGLYKKAIKAFEKLSLKYPEKSIYFAQQIEEVTNLLNK